MIHLQNKFKKEKGFLLSLFLLIFLTACQTTKLPQDFSNDYLEVHKGSYSYYISKVDLETPGLQIICKIDTETFFNLDDFADSTGATYAINTTPFSIEDGTTQLLGVTKFNKQIYTAPVEKYSALGFYFNNKNQIRAKIIENQTENSLKNFPAVFGGYYTILKNGQILPYKNIKRSRSACGLDESGRYLYFMAVTSNFNLIKTGLSYQDCAEILKSVGCSDAIQFDGGHSTALVTPESGYVHTKKNRKVPAAFGIHTK